MKFLTGPLITFVLVAPTLAGDVTPQEIFDQRILPIFRSPDPSSCIQCHLSSVDLKQYILPSQEETFVSLRDQGLINTEHPSESKILSLIRMGDKDLDEGAKLIHEETRQAEYDAFAEWVKACCGNSKLRDLPTGTKFAKPDVPDEVIRHARKSRIVDSFARNIWSQRMRCFPCHTPHEVDASNPKHQAAVKKQKEFADQYDAEALDRLRIFRESPEATLRHLVEASKTVGEGQMPLLDLAEPANSLLVLKPTSKLPMKNADGTFQKPSYVTPVSHMGGLKMHMHDHSYKSFVAWIQDYARVVDGTYKTIDELPSDNWYASQMILRIKATPEAWKVGTPVQMFVHEWDAASQVWRDEPIAFTQGAVTPRRFANGALFLLGTDEERTKAWSEKARLPKGKYLIKAYVDNDGKLEADPTAILSNDAFAGQIELPKARWRTKFKFAEVVDGKQLNQ